MSPDDIKRVQQLLVDLHFNPGPIDGIYGPRTRQALDAATGRNVEAIAPAHLEGVDVSSYQGVVDWQKVANAGIKFAWVKCSEGTTHKNKRRQQNLDGARGAGIAVGGYHFARPDTYQRLNMEDARREAKNFLNCYGTAQPDDLVPALDLESGLLKNDHDYNLLWVLEWAATVEDALGVTPIIYTARWASTSRILRASREVLDRLAEFPLWWAEYRPAKTVAPTKNLAPWRAWDVWQWTGGGKVAGIEGKCDRNRMKAGSLERLKVNA